MSSASVPCAPLHLQHPHKQLICTILLLASAFHSDCAASRLVRRSLHHIVVFSSYNISPCVLRFSLTPTSPLQRRSAVAPLSIGTTAAPASSSPPRFVSNDRYRPIQVVVSRLLLVGHEEKWRRARNTNRQSVQATSAILWLRSWHHCVEFGTILPRAPAHADNVEMPKMDTHVTFQHSLRLPTKHPPRINMNFLWLLVATNRAKPSPQGLNLEKIP